jgi:hypothetical protein
MSSPTMMGSTSASDERVADDAFKAEPSKMESDSDSDSAKKEKSYDWILASALQDMSNVSSCDCLAIFCRCRPMV